MRAIGLGFMLGGGQDQFSVVFGLFGGVLNFSKMALFAYLIDAGAEIPPLPRIVGGAMVAVVTVLMVAAYFVFLSLITHPAVLAPPFEDFADIVRWVFVSHVALVDPMCMLMVHMELTAEWRPRQA